MSKKTILGLTGTFGSGKSTVAHFFEELGACIVDADKLAHEALMPGSEIYDTIRKAFPDAELPGGGFDVKKLANVVFRDAEKKKKLESIVHPYVFNRLVEEAEEAEEPVVVVEVPLLYETGYDQFCSQVIVVSAEPDVMQKRLMEKGFSPEEIKLRQSNQMPLAEKIKKANFVINNSGTFQQTRREVEGVWKKCHPAPKGAL